MEDEIYINRLLNGQYILDKLPFPCEFHFYELNESINKLPSTTIDTTHNLKKFSILGDSYETQKYIQEFLPKLIIKKSKEILRSPYIIMYKHNAVVEHLVES